MIKVENIDVYGFETAIRGMRNPMNSWSKSDSYYEPANYCDHAFIVGDDDLALMRKLYKAGTEHRKFARQIWVGMDITTNHTVWAEADTYKIGVTRNSCSKMHKIHVKPFELDDFSHEGIEEVGGLAKQHLDITIYILEMLRVRFNDTHDKKYWRAMIELLPMGYNLKATVTMNYENVFNIIRQRSNHKMFEWVQFCDILRTLPYVNEIIGESE